MFQDKWRRLREISVGLQSSFHVGVDGVNQAVYVGRIADLFEILEEAIHADKVKDFNECNVQVPLAAVGVKRTWLMWIFQLENHTVIRGRHGRQTSAGRRSLWTCFSRFSYLWSCTVWCLTHSLHWQGSLAVLGEARGDVVTSRTYSIYQAVCCWWVIKTFSVVQLFNLLLFYRVDTVSELSRQRWGASL